MWVTISSVSFCSSLFWDKGLEAEHGYLVILVAPYGQTDAPNLKSVFDVPHLVKDAFLLETQCTFGR